MTSLDEQVASLATEAYNTSNIVDKLVVLAAVIISVISLITTLALSKGLIAMLKKPVEEIEQAAVDMAAGSLHVKLDYTSEDEFGSLADSMRMLCANISTIITDIGTLLSELSDGNFQVSSGCHEQYVGDYSPILISMRSLRDKLNETLLHINSSAEMVAEGSVQLSKGAQILAEGSREQANMLNQIQQGIEQISANVQTNSSAAEETSATSEELSAQADYLKSEVNKFKLK